MVCWEGRGIYVDDVREFLWYFLFGCCLFSKTHCGRIAIIHKS